MTTFSGGFLQELSDTLFELLEKRQLCDTEIVTDAESLWAHSVVLATASRPLRNVFVSTCMPRYRIQLYGCDIVAIRMVLRFLYTGHLVCSASSHVELPDLNKIYAVCRLLGVPNERIQQASLGLDQLPIANQPSPLIADISEGSNQINENWEGDVPVLPNNTAYLLGDRSKSASTADVKTSKKLANTTDKSNTELDPSHSENVNAPDIPSSRRTGVHSRLQSVSSRHKRAAKFHSHADGCVLTSCSKCKPKEGFLTKSLRRPGAYRDRHSRFMCPKCGQRFNTSSRLRSHEFVKHSAERPHVCDACGKVYRFRSSLSQHIRIAHPRRPGDAESDERNGWLCDLCGKSFSGPASLRRHAQRIHLDHRPHVCRECGKRCIAAHLLRDHIASKHGSSKPYTCPTCSAGFTLNGNLLRHIRLHSSTLVHTCDQCGQNFAHRQNLIAHRRTFHLDCSGKDPRGFRQFSCPSCGETFRTRLELNRHKLLHPELQQQSSIHQSVYSCPVCEKNFTKSCYLANHSRVHRNKPIQCPYCPKKFAFEARRLKHCNSKHGLLLSLQTGNGELVVGEGASILDKSSMTLQSSGP